MHINDNIKERRELKKLSQQKMADLLGEKRSTYAEWERDTVPRADIFYKIASILEVSMDELLSMPKLKGKTKTNDQEDLSVDPRIKRLEQEIQYYRDEVLVSLDSVRKNVVMGRAELRGSIEYHAMKDALNDDAVRREIMEQINRLIRRNLTVDDKKDNQNADDSVNK